MQHGVYTCKEEVSNIQELSESLTKIVQAKYHG